MILAYCLLDSGEEQTGRAQITETQRVTDTRPPQVALEGDPDHREVAGEEPADPQVPAWKARFFYCLKVFLGVRIGLGILALVATALVQSNPSTGVPGWDAPLQTPGWHNLFTAWERWDALWFLRIAEVGYSNSDLSAAFFPFYPMLIRTLSPAVGGSPLASALIISNAAYLGALFVMYELTREEFNEHYARRTVLYAAIFPTAFFFLAPYTESVFLLLVLTSLLAAKRKQWALAGAAGAIAAGTRSIGIVLVLPLALEAWNQARHSTEGRMRTLARTLPWAVGPALGLFSYLFYWYRSNGDWFTPVRNQSGWHREFSFVWDSLLDGTKAAFQTIGEFPRGNHMLDWIIVVIALAALVWVVRRARAPYIAYAVMSLLVPLSFINAERPFTSVPRFIIVIFPLYWALVAFADKFRAHDFVVAVSAAGLGVCTVLFVNWYFMI